MSLPEGLGDLGKMFETAWRGPAMQPVEIREYPDNPEGPAYNSPTRGGAEVAQMLHTAGIADISSSDPQPQSHRGHPLYSRRSI